MQSKKTLWDSLYLGIYDILSNRIIKTNESEDPDVAAKWASREFADVLADSVESFINTGGINLDSVEELTGYFSNGSANSAVKLKDTHTFWGQPFNGTQDVLGDLKNVGKISASGNISTLGGVSAGGSSDLFELFSSGYTSITEVGTGNGVAFIEPDVASIKVHKANFLTEHQSLSAYYTSSEIDILLSTKVAIEDLSQSILDITDPLYLKLSGGNLTGSLSGTTASFTGNVHSDSNISANGGVSAGGISDLGYSSPVIDLYFDWSDNAPANKALGAALGVELHDSVISLSAIAHSHSNKAILDGTTASFILEEKTKLAGIESNANNYVLPYATTAVLGGVAIGSNIDVSSGIISVKNASISAKGVVQLSDSVSSTSSSLSATSKAVKIAWDLANSKWAWNENDIKVVVVNRSLTADKLTNEIYLWGQLFDGSSDIDGDLHSTGNISADGGVYAGGIGDLFEAITSGYNDILPHPNDTGNAVTSITSNGGSTLYYRREKSFSEVGHNHDTAYSLLGHVHDDRYYTEVEISNIFSGLASVTGYNKSNWDTAYSWGDHASAGYALASTLSTHIANVSNPHSVTKSQVGLGNVEDTKLSTWVGTTNITTLGTISGGTWHGSIVEVLYGGTGKSSIAVNKMLYASSANVFSEIPTTSFGRGLLNTASGTMIVGLNADLLDGLHGVDFVNVASTQEITGSKTFTKTLNILESLNVYSNIHAGGNISADGGVSAGGISDLSEYGSSGFNDIEYIGSGNIVTNVDKNVSSLKVFKSFSVYSDTEIDTIISTEVTNRNTAITDAINQLDVDSVGGSGEYISAIRETNGKISATASNMPTLLSQFTDDLGSSPIHTHSQYMLASARGAVNGVAPLDINRKIPAAYLYDYFFGQVLYGGGLGANALATLTSLGKSKLGTTNSTITLTNNNTAITGYVANEGIYYIVTSAQTFAGISFEVGDWCISNGSAWTKVDNTDAVASVAGLTGSISKASLLSALNVADGAQVNKIESVKLNGTALIITSKAVNVNACTSITAPAGLSVAALTTGGLIAISLDAGYAIPTTANITQIGTNTTNITNEITNRIAAINQEVTDRNTAISNAVNALDVDSVGGGTSYLSAIQQTDGKISATAKLTNTLFTGLVNDLEQLSVTIGGKNLKLTVDYATKANQLKNKQKLWGRDFNGTANVSGNMTGVGSVESNGDIHTTQRIYGDAGVFAGGIGDLSYITPVIDLYTNWSDNAPANKALSAELGIELHNTKVDKVAGYSLSKNDLSDALLLDLNANTAARHSHNNKTVLDNTTASFLTADRNKLDGIAAGANNYSLPTASSAVLGGIKVGSRLTINSGVLSADIQSDNNFTSTYKNKLDGIATGANLYVHPTYTAQASGLYKVTVDSSGHVSAVVAVVKSDITALGIPAQDTVYVHPSSGVTAGTYRSVTVDVNGHVTTGTNPTTLAGYGITDAASASALSTLDANIDACIGALAGQVLSLQAKNQFDELFAEYINVRTISADLLVGYLKGNADTSTKLYTARTLWGRSFDGTANVSGNMTGVGSLDASGDIRTTERIYGAKGVFSGGIADLTESMSSGYNLIVTTGSGNAVTSVDDNGSTLNIHKDITFAVALDVSNSLATKVDKVTGYSLSKNDLTDALLSALNANTSARHSHGNKTVLDATTASFLTADRTKLDGIADNANLYIHPSHTAHASGLYKVTVDSLGHISVVAAVAKSDITALGIPAQDTVYVHPVSGVTPNTYKSVTVDANGHVTAGGNPTTLAGYGITDAKIVSGVITLGANTITPLVTHQTIYALTIQKNGTTIDTYTPNSASKTINISDVASATSLDTLTTNTDQCIGALVGQIISLQLKNQFDELYAEYAHIRTLSSDLLIGALKGNADTATAFSAAKSIALTGDISGSASSTGGWSIATTIGAGRVTNDMLVKSFVTISGKSVSLGGSISRGDLRSGLGLQVRRMTLNSYAYDFLSYNNVATDSFSLFAPTAAGTSGQLLISTGATPTWVSQGSGGGINADKLDNMHAVDFVNVASAQTITGAKTFSASASFLNSISVANNINAGGIIQGVGGVFAGGIADLQEDSWTTPTLTNGTHGTTYGEVRYRRIGTNVQIDGSFTITWDGSSQLRLFNLPSGHNPSHNMSGWLYNNSNGIWRYVIGTDGWVSLINVKSIVDGSSITTATTCMFDSMIFPIN